MKAAFYFFGGIILTLVVIFFSFGKSDSSDDKRSFVRIGNELQASCGDLHHNNWKLMELVLMRSKSDSSNMDSIISLAKKIDKDREALTNFIVQQRGKIIGSVDGIPSHQGDTLRLSLIQNPFDKDKTKTFLFGNSDADSSSCLTHQIKLKLAEFEKEVNSIIALSYGPADKIRLQNDVYDFSSGKFVSWEDYHFQNCTLIEAVIAFKQIEISCLITEDLALEALLKKKYPFQKIY